MHPTTPPWLAQLDDRDAYVFHGNGDSDVAIIGAGIAGVSTAYQLLMHTTSSVLLIDAGQIAHGATGRNAGHVVNEFERPLTEIIDAFGKEMALGALKDVESAWTILEEMLSMSGIERAYENCKGYNGFTNLETLLENLETHDIREQAGLTHQPILIRSDESLLKKIPQHLMRHVMPVPHSAILELLETDTVDFMAVEITQIGVMNSAVFCNALVQWMMKKFADRLVVAENLPVHTITLEENAAKLETTDKTLTARHVVLCTNGYKNISIQNTVGEDIHSAFQKMVHGSRGYMTGYLDKNPKPISALCYYDPDENYLTRRPYLQKDGTTVTLTCLGGSDTPLADGEIFNADAAFPADVEAHLSHEILKTYRSLPETAHHTFQWQGLMGYTSNTIRRVGFEPRNTVLLYNLGCNGVGILPSIYGSKRIRQLLNGDALSPSIFDPDKGDL